jgi:5-(carboxyamino)imidazole ribonucleotide synthase
MKIAIFGAGQLAMMMIEESSKMNHDFIVVDPSSNPPASKYAKHLQTDYTDKNTLDYIAANYDVATIDFENVDISAMRFLEKNMKVFPPSRALEVCQDRLLEKNLFKELNINVTKYKEINNISDLKKYCNGNESNYLLKSRRFGYDGKNQFKCNSNINLLENLISECSCIIEEIVDFTTEVSLVCVRQDNHNIIFYPLIENFHKEGILRYSKFPYENKELQDTAERYGRELLSYFDYVGVLVIEFFVSKEGKLVANEMAPRVHNSGHWSIEGSSASQFELHIRAITGNLDNNSINFKPSLMFNVLSKYPKDKILKELEFHYFHSYGKEERSLRKLGHITIIKNSADQLESIQPGCLELLGN